MAGNTEVAPNSPGAGSSDLSKTTKKRESSTQPTETRKKIKIKSEGGADVQDGEQHENDSSQNRDPGDEYEAMVEHAKVQNEKNSIDLKLVNTLLNEAPDAPETSDDKSDGKAEEISGEIAEKRSNETAEQSSNQILPHLVPSGTVISVIPAGQNLGSTLSQERGGRTPRLSPTIVNNVSIFDPLSNGENKNHHTGDKTEDIDGREIAKEGIEVSIKEEPSVSDDQVNVPDASMIKEEPSVSDSQVNVPDASMIKEEEPSVSGDQVNVPVASRIKEEETSVSDGQVNVPDASTINYSSVTGDIKPSNALGDKQSTITNDSSKRLIPAVILEKGMIRFFYRPRVGVEGFSQRIEDIAHTYFTLCPLIRIKETIPGIPSREVSNTCLLSLPKKIWPKSGQGKSLCFVDGVDMTVKDLNDRFDGSPQLSHAKFITDGVYAILSTGRENHLAYHLTNPETSEFQPQKCLGIKAKGSFVCLVKNPKVSSRKYLDSEHVALYSDELQKKFGDSQWTPLVPKHLIYEGTQILLIGQGESKVKNEENDKPEEEMIKVEEEVKVKVEEEEMIKSEEEAMIELEEEDYGHVETLKEDDNIFLDLETDANVFSGRQAIWNQVSRVLNFQLANGSRG